MAALANFTGGAIYCEVPTQADSDDVAARSDAELEEGRQDHFQDL